MSHLAAGHGPVRGEPLLTGTRAFGSPREVWRRLVVTHPEAILALQARLLHGAVMAVALPLVIWRMPLAVQGYFFSFQNLTTMFALLDLGLGVVTVQTTSHYRTEGDGASLARYWNFAWRLQGGLLALLLVAVGAIGAWIFAAPGESGAEPAVVWLGPWLAYLPLCALTQATQLVAACLEGAVSPALAWRFQRDTELAAGVLFIIALAAGTGLWSLPILAAGRCAAALPFLWHRRRQLPRLGPPAGLAWWQARVWDFQWRVAIGNAASFLLFRAFTPMVLAVEGVVPASRFGLSWALMSMLLTVSTAWPASQAARFSRLATARDFDQLDRRFRTLLLASTGTLAIGCLASLGVLWGAGQVLPGLARRFADPGTIAILLAAGLIQHIMACFAPYLRAGRSDPLLPLTIIGSVVTCAACAVAAGAGMAALAGTYLVCSAAGLPWCLWCAAVLRRRRPSG